MAKSDEYIGDELSLFSRAYNWKRYWSGFVKPQIQSPVLEVGAGIGSNLELLRHQNQSWTALEPDETQANQIKKKYCAETHCDKKLTVVTGTLADVSSIHRYKTILYIDVLEHVKDDRAEVKRALAHLDIGGKLIVLAPAHQRLYSPFDNAVGHYRRYNKKTLSDLTPVDPEVKISQLFYLDSVGCLASFANAILLRATLPSPKQIWLWDSIMVPISRVIDKLTWYRIGKTVVIVWTKLD